MSDYRDQKVWEEYYQYLHRFFRSPEAFGEMLSLLGNPKDGAEFYLKLKRVIERQERWDWLRKGLMVGIAGFIAVGTAVGLIAAAASWLMGVGG